MGIEVPASRQGEQPPYFATLALAEEYDMTHTVPNKGESETAAVIGCLTKLHNKRTAEGMREPTATTVELGAEGKEMLG